MPRKPYAVEVGVLAIALLGQGFVAASDYRVTVFRLPETAYGIRTATGSKWGGQGPRFIAGDYHGEYAHWWDGTRNVDLHPPGFQFSTVIGMSKESQVGEAFLTGKGVLAGVGLRAMLWRGTAESAVNLHPAEYDHSSAYGVWGDLQVGSAEDSQRGNAMLWRGTAESAVNLHPVGYASSIAFGVYGNSQVGMAGSHAALWYGTPESFVDLHPPEFGSTFAAAVNDDIQLGNGYQGNTVHALLWRGSKESVVDLHPIGYEISYAQAASKAGQVGHAFRDDAIGGGADALLWRGSAESVVNLHPYLSDFPELKSSVALGISDDGVISGYAETRNAHRYFVRWTPVPEPMPSMLALCGAGFVTAVYRQRRGRFELVP